MVRNFSITDENFPAKEIVEPLTLIRQDQRIKTEQLSEGITEFLEFLMKVDFVKCIHICTRCNTTQSTCQCSIEFKMKCRDCEKQAIPYALRPANRSEYKPYIQTLEKSLTYSLTTAKRIRMELYSNPNEEVKYDYDNSQLPPQKNDQPQQENKIKQMLGMKKTVFFDPHSPMAKMEELVAGLTEILFTFKKWLKWFEGLILEGLRFNTAESLQSELNQLIEIFGTDIEPNIWIAFQYCITKTRTH